MKRYKTIEKESAFQWEIDKSKFIASAMPVTTKEEGEDFIKEVKRKYKDATHNVPAIVVGENFQVQWASDDGEPQGTAGAPIVQMLVKEGITNIALVVTRYFGGIKLGTGGLVRAYTSTAKKGVEESGICIVEETIITQYEIEYTNISKIEARQKEGDFQITNIVYAHKVTVELTMKPIKEEQVNNIVMEITKGDFKIVSKKMSLSYLSLKNA